MAGERGRGTLADDPDLLAAVLLQPREVVVVVNLVADLGAEDLQHFVNDDVTAGVRVLACEGHRLDVGLTELGVDAEQDRR